MKFGVRTPSLKRRLLARTSVKRMVRSKVRVPKGMGIVTNPKKAVYNKVYNKTTISADKLAKNSGCLTLLLFIFIPIGVICFI